MMKPKVPARNNLFLRVDNKRKCAAASFLLSFLNAFQQKQVVAGFNMPMKQVFHSFYHSRLHLIKMNNIPLIT